MKSIHDLLLKQKEKKPLNLDEKTVFFIVNRVLEREFGKIGRKNISPQKLISSLLVFKAANSLWSSEFWLRKDGFIKEINKELGGEVIKRIRISQNS